MRELQNVIERAVILARGAVVDVEALPELATAGVAAQPAATSATPEQPAGQRTIAEVERGYVEQVLAETELGHRRRARRRPPAGPAPQHVEVAAQALGRHPPARSEQAN